MTILLIICLVLCGIAMILDLAGLGVSVGLDDPKSEQVIIACHALVYAFAVVCLSLCLRPV